MRRLLFLYLLVPSAAWADTPAQAPEPICEVAGAQALAKAKGVALKDLPGIDGTTKLSLHYRDGVVKEASVRTSSGNDELDEVLKTCELRREVGTNTSYTIYSSYEWKFALLPPADTRQPRPAGPAHVCMKNYPPEAVAAGRVGVTDLAFEITAFGDVDGLIVVASSGSFDLDLASTKCAAKWRYVPAEKDGKPISVTWSSQVSWSLDNNSPRNNVPLPDRDFSTCVRAYPDAAGRALKASNGITIVRYTLADGVVTGAELLQQSGDPVLDDHALVCVKGWKFRSLYRSGSAATGRHTAIIDWAQKTLP